MGLKTCIGETSGFELKYERRASIPLKRVREAFESDIESDESGAEDSLNQSGFSLDTSLGTRSTDWYEAQMKLMEQRHQAEMKKKDAEIAELKAELEPLKSLFKPVTKPTRGESGQCFEYSDDLKAFTIRLHACGIPTAHIHQMYESMMDHFEFDDDYKVPSISYLNKLRSGMLNGLLDQQTLDFVTNSQNVAISFDATTMHGKQHVALLIFDQSVQYNCVSIREIEGKRGDQIAGLMLAMIDEVEGLRAKIKCLISDRCAAQVMGNRLLLEVLNRGREEADKVFEISCNLHTTSGTDAHSSKAVSADTGEAYCLLKFIFGNRKSIGFKRACLKDRLRDELGGVSAGFLTDVGSRFGVNFNNGVCLLRYETAVKNVLALETSSHPKHVRLLAMMTDTRLWNKVRLEMGCLVLVWSCLIGPFHTTVSKDIPYGDIKMAYETAFTTMTRLLNAECSFSEALEMAKALPHSSNSATPEALVELERHWSQAGPRNKTSSNLVLRTALENGKWKLSRDWEIMRDLPVDLDCILPWTNR